MQLVVTHKHLDIIVALLDGVQLQLAHNPVQLLVIVLHLVLILVQLVLVHLHLVILRKQLQ